MKWVRRTFAFALLIVVVSCNVQINASSELTYNPKSIDFGIIKTTKSSTITVELKNTSDEDLYLIGSIINIPNENSDEYEIVISEGNITSEILLETDMTHYIDIKFTPLKQHKVKAELKIGYIFDSRYKIVAIPISGEGDTNTLEINPSNYDFKHTNLNESKIKSFVLRSISEKQVKVTSVKLVDYGLDTAAEELFISSGWDDAAKILSFGESFFVEVTFTPLTVSAKMARLEIVVEKSLSNYYVDIDGHGSNNLEFITQSPLKDAVKGSLYNLQLEALGGDGKYSFIVVKGFFPPGLTLSKTGEITGVPTNQGEYSFEIRLSDDSNNFVVKGFVLNVSYASLIRDPNDVTQDYIFSEGNDDGLYSVNLVNVGYSPLTITSINLTGSGVTSGEAMILSLPVLPRVVNPNQSVNITIHVESLLDIGRSIQLTVDHTGYESKYIGNFWWSVEGGQHIYIIDASGSMLTKHNVSYPIFDHNNNMIVAPTRWDASVYHIGCDIADLDKSEKFEVIVFTGNLYYCFGQMVNATTQNRYTALSWLFNYSVAGCSNMYDGMYNGFHNYGIMAEMYVYSDGGANTALLIGCAGCACASWIGARTVTDSDGWVKTMAAKNPSFHLYMMQFANSPTSFMQQIGAKANCSYELR